MIITIGGKPGSGKSTIAKRLALALGVPHYSVGDLRRQLARDKGLTLEELNTIGEHEDWTDRQADEYQKKLGEKESAFVIDGRTSFYFLPQSLKLFFDVDPLVAAKRIADEMRRGERLPESIDTVDEENVRTMLARRMESDIKRYQQYYQIKNIYDTAQYDWTIDTSTKTPAEVFQSVCGYLSERGIKLKGQD